MTPRAGCTGAGVELRTVRVSDPEAAPALVALAAEYRRRYGSDEELRTTTVEEFDPPAGRFVVAIDGGETVAAGAYHRIDDDACEVKRMWTREDRRRQGLAARVLADLERAAGCAGYRVIRLETGPAQPEAQAFYAALGYRRIPPFGRYPQALAFEKHASTVRAARPEEGL